MATSKPKRSRGVLLTPSGISKLNTAKTEVEMAENYGDRLTFEAWSERTNLNSRTIARIFSGHEKVDKRSLEQFFHSLDLTLDAADYGRTDSAAEPTPLSSPHVDWREAVDVPIFYGRSDNLAELQTAVVDERYRLVAILGMGGIGKTALTAKLTKKIQNQFDYVVWKSLRNAPPLDEILVDLIQFLSHDRETRATLPQSPTAKITHLLTYLKQHRCLLVLDNAESILLGQGQAGYYRDGYENYGDLWRRLSEVAHNSCLILTSREKPKEISIFEGQQVRSFLLQGLSMSAGRALLSEKGIFSGDDADWEGVIQHYGGNPLALKMVAAGIQTSLQGDLAASLAQIQQGNLMFGDIRDLLEQQFERLSTLEQEVMYWLAINRELVRLMELQADLVYPASYRRLPGALQSLQRRSLIEGGNAGFTLQPVVMEYVTDRLVEQLCTEITTLEFYVFKQHALVKAQSKDYVRDVQQRLLLTPLMHEMLAVWGHQRRVEHQLVQSLETLRTTAPRELSYAAGNIANLLVQLQADLKGYDFSHLQVWQADLRNVSLQGTNFSQADLSKSVFAETFSGIYAVAFSSDGQSLAVGDTRGQIRLYQIQDGRQRLICEGHVGRIWALAFSPDGAQIASGGDDNTARLWDVQTGRCLKTLKPGSKTRVFSVAFSPDSRWLATSGDAHTARLWDLKTYRTVGDLHGHQGWILTSCFSPDGTLLASSSDDFSIRLWDVKTGRCLRVLLGHSHRVWTLAFSPTGATLASGSLDRTIRLWDLHQGECLNVLEGHDDGVWSVAFAPTGDTLASSSWDYTVRLWNVATGEEIKVLQQHTNRVWSVAFSPKSSLLASGSSDQTVKLWDIETGHCVKTLRGYNSRIFAIASSPNNTIASGGSDQLVRLWNPETGQCLKTLKGHRASIRSALFTPDGETLITCGDDHTLKFWDVASGQCLRTFGRIANRVFSLALSPDGQHLVSSGDNGEIKLWDIRNGECIRVIKGDFSRIYSVVFSPDGQWLASGGDDMVVCLWDMHTGQCVKQLQGHTNWIRAVDFSPDGQRLISGGDDHTLKLWDASTGDCLRTLPGSCDRVFSVAFSPDGQWVANSGDSSAVMLWEIATGDCQKKLIGHSNRVEAIAFTQDGHHLISGSEDEVIKVWDWQQQTCLKTLVAPKLYDGMTITDATGLTTAQRATLKALGAID
ncbi:MAG: NB-ARC domain-containing protein [Cyanobacteria bacterium P01_A01_bin.137]